ncbi:branched-chain amino acid transport system II carrier protein [Staphylococcus nepalensis]|jgi:uncharacterized membrane protein YkvI|uniref:Branched-chain amino acid transport system II carrier protein n=2 Tax=Staphylococcus nepalensis TaxID=214473 RepID=A0A380GKB9_9STAP|nr:branched-chain amino acid transport system II carrier protein [Staphylococcus nepalensis]SUM66689.1 branched-chain amino acid transport system II carrier protein [Staphylococcus nepalensis]SUM94626.1 branched-chain amino acid transport system II carrier protein [Staphylococcus nepalensis]VDG66040.1 membrane protein [Lacrimispora indolis]
MLESGFNLTLAKGIYMKRIFLIGSAFIGIIVGAGFASGQEILQYFTSFGTAGILAGVVSTVLFAYVGMMLVWLGSKFKAEGHNDVIHKLTGGTVFGKVIAWLVDIVLIIALFGFGVVMLAGGGSNFEQQFGIPAVYGTALMVILVLLFGMLRVDSVVKVIGNITPLLIICIIIVAIYCLFTMSGSFSELDTLAKSHKSAVPHWFIAGVNYVSLNVGLGASMSIVMGGNERNSKVAAWGGLAGGFVLGLMIMVSHLAIFSKIETVGHLPLPMLGLVNDISPILGVFMSIVVYLMIFNTCLGMFYSLATRFTEIETNQFKIFYTIFTLIGFVISFAGFTDLMTFFYPVIGYMGIIIIIVLIYAPFKMKRIKKQGKSFQDM